MDVDPIIADLERLSGIDWATVSIALAHVEAATSTLRDFNAAAEEAISRADQLQRLAA